MTTLHLWYFTLQIQNVLGGIDVTHSPNLCHKNTLQKEVISKHVIIWPGLVALNISCHHLANFLSYIFPMDISFALLFSIWQSSINVISIYIKYWHNDMVYWWVDSCTEFWLISFTSSKLWEFHSNILYLLMRQTDNNNNTLPSSSFLHSFIPSFPSSACVLFPFLSHNHSPFDTHASLLPFQ